VSFAWKGFHSFGGGFSPSFGPSLTGGVTPIGLWDASTSTLAQLAALVSHSRTSLATMFDSTGKLTYAPNNLLTYSNTFSNAAWTLSTATLSSGVTDPLGGTNAWTLTATGAGALLYQNVTVPTSANGLFAVYVKRRTGSGTISLRQPAGAYSAVTVTGTWTQVSVVGPGNGAVNIAIQIATSGDAIDIYAATLSAVTYETTPRTADQVITTAAAYYGPRVDYDPSTLAAKGLLIEEARTNLLMYSEAFSNAAWSKDSGAITASGTAPSGVTGSLFTPSAGSSTHRVIPTAATVTTATAYTATYYIAPNGYSKVALREGAGTEAYAAFNLSGAGSVLDQGSGGVGSITALANGYYRIQMVSTSSGTSFRPDLWVLDPTYTSGSVTGAWSANGTSGIYLFGAQLEVGSFATSYIPTGASSVTRAPDVVQFTGAALTALQGSAGSAIVQMTDQSVGYSAAGGVVLGGSSTYWLDLASGNMYSNSGSHFLNTANAAIAGSPYRAGVAWNASGRSLAMNGGTVATDAFGGWAATTPYLGSLSGTANFANGHVASFAIYNQRLPDATLQSKSVVNAAY